MADKRALEACALTGVRVRIPPWPKVLPDMSFEKDASNEEGDCEVQELRRNQVVLPDQ
jgi:hypothetical protein